MRLPPWHTIWHATTATIATASFACNLLPKSTVFNDYPRVKKAYETGINFVIALALNLRECFPTLGLKMPFVPGFSNKDVPKP